MSLNHLHSCGSVCSKPVIHCYVFWCFFRCQAALLSLREKALREKAKAELAWLQQRKKKPRDKRADDVFPNFEKREKRIRKNLQEQQVKFSCVHFHPDWSLMCFAVAPFVVSLCGGCVL